jgi:hypothetical protein
MSDTPRTDALTQHYFPGNLRYGSVVLWANFARELERELAQRTADLDRMTGQRNAALDAREITQRTLDGIDGVLSQRTAERDEARREVCYAYGSRAETLAAAERRGWDCFKEGNKTC